MLRIHPISTRGRSFPALGPFPVLRTVETEHPVRLKCFSQTTESKHRRTRGLCPRTLRQPVAAVPHPQVVKTHTGSIFITKQEERHWRHRPYFWFIEASNHLWRPSVEIHRHTLQTDATSAARGRGWGSFCLLSSSTNGSAAPCTSSKVHCLAGSSGAQAQPSLCSLKTHFVDW